MPYQNLEKYVQRRLKLTKENFDKFIILQDQIKEIAFEKLKIYCDIVEESSKYLDEIISIDSKSIVFEGDEYWSYGGYEKHYIEMPVEMLFDDNYIETLKQKQLEKKKVEIELRWKKEREALEKKEQQEREAYERLKSKFENKG